MKKTKYNAIGKPVGKRGRKAWVPPSEFTFKSLVRNIREELARAPVSDRADAYIRFHHRARELRDTWGMPLWRIAQTFKITKETARSMLTHERSVVQNVQAAAEIIAAQEGDEILPELRGVFNLAFKRATGDEYERCVKALDVVNRVKDIIR